MERRAKMKNPVKIFAAAALLSLFALPAPAKAQDVSPSWGIVDQDDQLSPTEQFLRKHWPLVILVALPIAITLMNILIMGPKDIEEASKLVGIDRNGQVYLKDGGFGARGGFDDDSDLFNNEK
jgi:hypothetical protein